MKVPFIYLFNFQDGSTLLAAAALALDGENFLQVYKVYRPHSFEGFNVFQQGSVTTLRYDRQSLLAL